MTLYQENFDNKMFPSMFPMTFRFKDIEHPSTLDVLCGRGGASLKHNGNQLYRKLVSLNKAQYTTCPKPEKLKISKSIVAAVRQSGGRFLERDGIKGTWYDIGDKKAVEKTSQALREGQPQLRQQITEMKDTHGVEVKTDPVELLQQQLAEQEKFLSNQKKILEQQQMAQQAHLKENGVDIAQPLTVPDEPESASLHTLMMGQMTIGEDDLDEFPDQGQEEKESLPELLDHFDNNFFEVFDTGSAAKQDVKQPVIGRQVGRDGGRPPRPTNTFSHDSDSSSSVVPPPGNAGLQEEMNESGSMGPPSEFPPRKLDRRRIFAKMKYSRPPSVPKINTSRRSLEDDMPDIHMVTSTLSMLSNISSSRDMKIDDINSSMRNSDNKSRDENFTLGSRRSLMSGISKSSDDNLSIFSDLSRKIGNVSTQSIALSEISGIEEGDQEDLDESYHFNHNFALANAAHQGQGHTW